MAGRYDQNPFAVYWWFPFLLICLSLDELAESFLWGSISFVRYESEDLCWENMQNLSNERSIGANRKREDQRRKHGDEAARDGIAEKENARDGIAGKEKADEGNTVIRINNL
ncbi:hypothetical protein SASPL_112637 [Salvia splendens]|uniref:Uncharacterized protein n=1 Tax=Salvia splendens TaxID=180675 RepID=A0A8X8YEN2_SALSN|nr:hypothetical protein SASPL_112637 [Salvia splendens]